MTQKAQMALAAKGKCPFCKSDQVDYDQSEISEGTAAQTAACLDCDKGWMEHYTMTSIEELE